MNEQARRGTLVEPLSLEVASHVSELDELDRAGTVDAGLLFDDGLLQSRGRVVKFERDKSLAGRLLEILENTLVAGVVGHREAELRCRTQHFAELLDRKFTAVVSKRVNDDGCILAGLHDFIEIADGAVADGACQWPVDPCRFTALDEVPAHEIGCREVIVTGDSDQWTSESPGHVLHEARLAAARRALEQHRKAVAIGRVENLDLLADRLVVGLILDHGGLHYRGSFIHRLSGVSIKHAQS